MVTFVVPTRRPPCTTRFPYTTLFRSRPLAGRDRRRDARRHPGGRRGERGGDTGRARRRCVHGGVCRRRGLDVRGGRRRRDRKSTRLNSSHVEISYAVFCLKKKNYDRN